MMTHFITLIALFTLSIAHAGTLAVIDSGVDTGHTALVNNLWTNPLEIPNNQRDEDGNGYQDDYYGWNFAEQSPMVIDLKYLGTFSKDPYTFFEIQGRRFLGTETEADKKWIEEKRGDQEFMKEMGKFGNFVHGTHVAAIAAKNNEGAKVLSVKLIPTEVKPFFERIRKQKSGGLRDKILRAGLSALAQQQMNLMGDIAYYISDHGAAVANGSFGTGFPQAKMIVKTAYKIIFWKEADEEALKTYGTYLLEEMVKAGQGFVQKAPKTLFVFAAGNDGLDNDIYPASPASVKADNVITVAATYGNKYLAPFSNFGKTKVDVAAPGMLIDSAIPGNEFLRVSGTSQAAPFVANVADQVHNANPKLTPLEIKTIIMGTVDTKDFLKDKTVSGGVTNLERAVFAAKLTVNKSIKTAIEDALANIADEKDYGHELGQLQDIEPMPLTPLFN